MLFLIPISQCGSQPWWGELPSQWAAVNAETYSWPKSWRWATVECSATNGTSVSPSLRPREHFKRGKETIKAGDSEECWEMQFSGRDMAASSVNLLWPWCPAQEPHKSKTVNVPSCVGEGPVRSEPFLRDYGQLMVAGGEVSFSSVV